MKERQIVRTRNELYSDNSAEYESIEMEAGMNEREVEQLLTGLENAQENGVPERLNHPFLDPFHSVLYQKMRSKELWAEALKIAVHVRNGIRTRGISLLAFPHEIILSW